MTPVPRALILQSLQLMRQDVTLTILPSSVLLVHLLGNVCKCLKVDVSGLRGHDVLLNAPQEASEVGIFNFQKPVPSRCGSLRHPRPQHCPLANSPAPHTTCQQGLQQLLFRKCLELLDSKGLETAAASAAD